MIRIVLVGWSASDWRLFRQPQWIAQVRQDPAASALPRLHFDIEEEAYRACLDDWDGSDRESAVAALTRRGAVAVTRT